MKVKTNLQDDIKDSLIQVLNIVDKSTNDYEKILVLYFEIAVTEMAKMSCAINSELELMEGMEYLYKKFEGLLQTNLFNTSKYSSEVKCNAVTLSEHLKKMVLEYSISIYDIGNLFEYLFNLEYVDSQIKETTKRSDAGMFFSHEDLVKETINLLLENLSKHKLSTSTFIDPAMGAGIFLFELAENAKAKLNKKDFTKFIQNNIYGIDKNEILVDLFKVCFWIKYYKEIDDMTFLGCRFVAEDSLLLVIKSNGEDKSWEDLFPIPMKNGGFDYVIGNPPWGKIKANIREFNLVNGNKTREYQGIQLKQYIEDTIERKKWKEYQKYIRDYARMLKNSPNFTHQQYMVDNAKTGGDFDLYKYFLELSYNILKVGGKLGYIIPASFYMAEGATGLRHLLLENGDIEYMINFENKKHIFPIHPSFKFIVIVYAKKMKPGKIKKACFDLSSIEEINKHNLKKQEFVSYTRTFLKRCSNVYWSVPECKSANEIEILEKLYRKYPNMGTEEKGKWIISFNREFDMTMDSDKFIKRESLQKNKKYLPLYEGRMVYQYNSSKKIYINGTGRTAKWEINMEYRTGKIQPQYYVEDSMCKDIPHGLRAGYCDVTGQKNVRTILASLIPMDAVCGNKVPTCKFSPDNDITYHLYWIAVANSFVVDWMMRKKMTITLNFYHWYQIPFPKIKNSGRKFKCLVAWSALVLEKVNNFELSPLLKDKEIIDIYHANKDEHFWQLRLKIDVLIAEMYDISIEEMACILYGFPGLDANSNGVIGDKRYGTSRKASFVTRDYVLFEMMKKINCNMGIKEIFDNIGINIEKETGNIDNLEKRIQYYQNNEIEPYGE